MTTHAAPPAAQPSSLAPTTQPPSLAPTQLPSMSISDIQEMVERIAGAVESVISGKHDVIRTALIALLCDGHLLIEDVPGVGKTKLARALAGAIDASFRRIQFTPDLLPSDLTGVAIFDQQTRDFEFKPGAIFSHLIVGDEINRASPKTQSALLEAMEERQVTSDGTTYQLASPFMVIATQNPIEMEGTYALPEAQRDRFMAQVAMGYPGVEAEMAMLDNHGSRDPLEALTPVCTVAQVAAMIQTVRATFVAEGIRRYVVELAEYTRHHDAVKLGASPRASLQLLRAAKTTAVLAGRDYVLPDDVQDLAATVWSHRLLMTSGTYSSRHSAETVINDALAAVPVPSPRI